MEKDAWIMDAVTRGKFSRQQAEFLYEMFLEDDEDEDEEEDEG